MNDAQKAAFEEVERKRHVLKLAEGVVERARDDVIRANRILGDAIQNDMDAWIETQAKRFKEEIT